MNQNFQTELFNNTIWLSIFAAAFLLNRGVSGQEAGAPEVSDPLEEAALIPLVESESEQAPAPLATTVVESRSVSSGPRSQPVVTVSTAPTLQPSIVNEVVISPTRTPKLLEDVPSSISVIDMNEIARIEPLSIDDLLRAEPNIEFQGGPRYLGEQLIIRGEDGSAITIRVDDARQNYVSGHAGQRFFVETDFLSDIEVLRGGGSFLYGSGSAGVLNVSTLDPENLLGDGQVFGAKLKNGFHSNSGEWSNSFVGAVGNDRVKILAGVSHREGGNIRLGTGEELEYSAIKRESAMGKLVFTPSDETRFEFGITGYETMDQGGTNPQALAVNANNPLADRVISYSQIYGDWSYNPEINDLVDVKTSIYYNSTSQKRDYVAVPPNPDTGRSNSQDLDVYGIDLNNRSIIIGHRGLEHEFVYGIDYFHEKQDGADTRYPLGGGAGTFTGRPDAIADHFGIFLTDEFDITEELTVFTGVRFDNYSTERTAGGILSQEDSAILPQVGFDYDISDRVSLFGQYSEGFTAPTLNELYQDGAHFGAFPVFGIFVPNPELQPEESQNLELGLHFEDEDFGGGQFSARTSGFFKKGQNTIDTEVTNPNFFGPPPFNILFQAVNREETEIYGFEFSADYDREYWFAGLDIGMVRGEDKATGYKLNSITGDQIALTLGSRPMENLELGIEAIWNAGKENVVDAVDADGDATNLQTGGYDVYGVFGAWQINDVWTLRGGVDNIFDTAHERTNIFLGEPGRNAFISSTMQW
ncbi:MAG: TonB-dependent receptor [Verrucomicrobiales bacterium]|nr:TonB-dependent receptor [Verrucomicrobiales bacterium]